LETQALVRALRKKKSIIISGEIQYMYLNPLVAEGESVSPITNNVKKLLTSIVDDRRKEVGRNFHAESFPCSD